MFDIIYDNGNFIRPNIKTYIGILEFETLNDTYFDIDEKEHIFKVDDRYDFKIIGLSDENIKKSKRLRLETISFDSRIAAENFINAYLPSIRAYLLIKDFKYAVPLTPKIEELTSHRSCVGTINVMLNGEIRLPFDEKERFHIENEVWYRLYSNNNSKISNSNHLCIETSAFITSTEAKYNAELLIPTLRKFLNKTITGSFEISETTVFINMSAMISSISLECQATLSVIKPFDIKLSSVKNDNTYILSVLALLENKGFNDLPNLFNILELIQDDIGKDGSKFFDKIEEEGLALKKDIENFTYSVDKAEIVGLQNSRHSKEYKGTFSPKKSLTAEECRSVMKNFIKNWLDYKFKKK